MKCLLGLRVLLIREQERKTSSYGSSFLFKPHVFQFWNTATLFRPVKVHQKSAFTREKISQIGQNRPTFYDAKKYITLKKYTTADGGGGD